MGATVKFVKGLVGGAVAGALMVMLLTPESGPGTRQSLQRRIQAIREEAQRAAEAQRAVLEAELARLRGLDDRA